jgi:hypothetical protein
VCRAYNCAWKNEPGVFPEWLRPDVSGVIVSKITVPLEPAADHYEVAEASGKLDVKALNWFVQWSLDTGANVFYQIEGKHHAVGSEGFRASMRQR